MMMMSIKQCYAFSALLRLLNKFILHNSEYMAVHGADGIEVTLCD